MKKKDVAVFIEEMEAIGDDWTPEQVEDVYGDSTLEEALADRKSALGAVDKLPTQTPKKHIHKRIRQICKKQQRLYQQPYHPFQVKCGRRKKAMHRCFA